jgi:hypothetical protein
LPKVHGVHAHVTSEPTSKLDARVSKIDCAAPIARTGVARRDGFDFEGVGPDN